MIGQKQIHQKIQQLNFRDCHAKITQVDAQATLGNGVVVQVTGELSNAGQPMRRFTQTFVLAAQSPKKYYVHNDIFRYQVRLCLLLWVPWGLSFAFLGRDCIRRRMRAGITF